MLRTPISTDFANQYPLRILVVEDNAVNTKVLLGMLKRLGYEATVVDNGKKGVKAAEAEPFDVIFMDLQMPVMGGIEAAELIRSSPDVSEATYISAYTANARLEDRKACQEAGMHDFIAKPASIEDVTNMLARAYAWLATRD